MTRVWPTIVSVALLAIVLSALLRTPLDDGFPISTYPMFAQPRSTRIDLSYAIGIAKDGSSHFLPSEVVGTGEVLQAAAIYDDAVNGGGKRLGPLCTQIAATVAHDAVFAELGSIQIIAGSHDAIALLAHGTHGTEKVRWVCPVPR